MKTLGALLILSLLALVAAVSFAEAQPPASEKTVDETTVLRLQLLEGERQALEQYVLRLRAEQRALNAEGPAASRNLETKQAEQRAAMEKAAKDAGVTLDGWHLDVKARAWRKKAGGP